MRNAWRAFLVLVLTAVLSGLAGCSDGVGAGSPPAESAAPAMPSGSSDGAGSAAAIAPPQQPFVPATKAAPASNVPLPTEPAGGFPNSEAGLRNFLKHWYELFRYAYRTGITAPVRGLTGPECGRCNGIWTQIDEVYAKDGWYIGEEMSVSYVGNWDASDEAMVRRMPVRISIREAMIADGTGGFDEIHTETHVSTDYFSAIYEEPGGWKVLDVG